MNKMIEQIQRLYPQIYMACHRDHIRAKSNPAGISNRDAMILNHLASDKPMALKSLAAHLNIGLSTLSEAIAKLESKGLVSRRQDVTDRRKVHLFLTEKGSQSITQSSVLDAIHLQQVLEHLNGKEQTEVVHGLELLARACRHYQREGRSP